MIEKKTLEDLISQGLSNSQIAESLGVGKHIIKTHKRKYGLTKKIIPLIISKDELKFLLDSGMNNIEIAKKLGVKSTQVAYIKQKYDLTDHNYFNLKSVNKEQLKKYIDDGLTNNELSNKFGVSISTIKLAKKTHDLNIDKKENTKHIIIDDLKRLFLYENKSCRDICRFYNVSFHTIKSLLKTNKITRYNVNIKHEERYEELKNNLSKEILENMLVKEVMFKSDICKLFNTDIILLNKLIEEYSIVEPNREPLYRNKEWLNKAYSEKNVIEIVNDFNITLSCLNYYIDKFEINRNKCVDIRIIINKEKFQEMYIKNQLSITEISKQTGLTQDSISTLIDEYKIDRRTFNTAMYLKSSSFESRKKRSAIVQKISLDQWNGFVNTENSRERKTAKYREWRNSVFEKDHYTCQVCFKTGEYLQAHHIKNFSKNIDNRYEIENGITLCKEDHSPNSSKSFHSIFGNRNNSEKQIDEYVENYNFYKDIPDWETFENLDKGKLYGKVA